MRKVLPVLVTVLAGSAMADTTKPRVQLGTPTVSVRGEATAIATVVKRNSSKLGECYAEFSPGPGVYAVTMRFSVTPAGKVVEASFDGSEDPLRLCLVDRLSSLKFVRAKGAGRVDVVYPMTFAGTSATSATTSTAHMSLPPEDHSWAANSPLLGKGPPPPQVAPRFPTVTLGQAKVTGALDEAIVRRYVKRQSQQILYCYEKELVSKPTAQRSGYAGTVTVNFAIGADGQVTSAKATGFKDKVVEACVANVLTTIEFPQPKQGTVTIAYPFTFSPG